MTAPTFVRPVEADGWPGCPTPDCEYKVCKWAGTGLCYQCSRGMLGQEEMDRRYRMTRAPDGSWNGLVP